MKKVGFIGITILLFSVILIAGQVIVEGPTASNAGDNIIIRWKTGDESGVSEFQIWRSGGQGSFMQVGTVSPKGNNSSYEFEDRSVFKTESSVYNYRIAVVFNDNTRSLSSTITVSHLSSTARRTWGSIKAMFR
ncbi:MAG TPA: hypothetical protein PK595_04145 [Bacteroidota bacterium]|nr:hypothetical protein [Bacteroidota bacterium]